MPNQSFKDFYNDDRNVPPAERALIDFEVELTRKLIAARKAKGLTQVKLALMAGVKPAVVSRFENLNGAPRVEILFKLLTTLGYKLTIIPSDSKLSDHQADRIDPVRTDRIDPVRKRAV
ncbi:MAG: helix-turn-helix domain-containing protein [Deltaproteobacteria bacterium]|nr:helix-turn-helix domain-containing protein [Deltaproteobacteria bacterium]